MNTSRVAFFFGAGAEIAYGLEGGDSFNGALLRNDYSFECSSMLGDVYKEYPLIHSASTKVYLQTINKNRKEAKENLRKEDYQACVDYIDNTKNKPDYSAIRSICGRWYKDLKSGKETKETSFFLKQAVFYEALDSKFNALRNVQEDRTGDARRVISAYVNVFVLMLKGLYEIDNDFDWQLESVIKLLKEGTIKNSMIKDTYYDRLKDFLDRIKKRNRGINGENQEDDSILGIATSNYTPLIEKCTAIEPIYLHGRLNWFEDYESLRVYDVYIDSDVVCERKQYVFPFIMIPSGVKPLICQKQIEEYNRFLKLLSESNLLCVIGYRFNSEDNHINSLIGQWLEKPENKMVYFNFENGVNAGKLLWLYEKEKSIIYYNPTNKLDHLIEENKILWLNVDRGNSLTAFDDLLSYIEKTRTK